VAEGACLHLMLDDDLEEIYHARYMEEQAQRAGLRTKLVCGVAGLCWGTASDSNTRVVVDSDGEEVRFVWKTWAWETVFDEYAAQQQ